ncbi:hypothetical protein FEM03_15280 [Phragmitibacter flavus]|uniref:Uncharacterized protein n=1 Tax=Phragmitibacter flavus TaxID=2576071 RepID=A0A5R8KBK1_9BACT|nr:hypothetical protein [Phragmitibacter flavus]TLD69694.1 hypothetical protein FEM03_15280 [Phragmitibacter flavus]
MHTVPVQIVRFVEEHQPSVVECVLIDAFGHQWSFIDKDAVFTPEILDAKSCYPLPGVVACEVVREWIDENGRSRCIIDTERPWDVSAKNGEMQFEVFLDQLSSY